MAPRPLRLRALSVLALASAAAVCPPPAGAVPTVSCSSQNLTVTPLQSGVFYIDTATNYLGSYVGYKVANGGGTARTKLWLRLESFTGGKVAPADGGSTTAALPLDDIPASGSTTGYTYLKASGETTTAQTHQLVLYSGKPDAGGTEVCRDTETISAVSDVIKAAANKVDDASMTGSATLGGSFSITVKGHTGTIGSGPANDPGVVRFSPAVAATWPSSAFRLVGVTHKLPDTTGAASFADVLWRGGLTYGDTPYAVTYTFRVVGPTTTSTPLIPVQNIASGTQVKHTDPGTLTALAPIPVVTSTTTVGVAAGATGPYTAGATVPLTATITNTGTGAVALDEVTAWLPAGWSYKAGTAKVGGATVADPYVSGGTSLRFVGPFTVAAASGGTPGTKVVSFDAVAGSAGTSGSFSAVGALAGGQVDATTTTDDNAPASVTLAVLGAPTAAADTVSAAAGGSSTWDVVANDTLAGGTATLTIKTPPQYGDVTVVGGKLVYTADEGYSGPDQLEYTITTDGGTSSAIVSVTIAAPPAAPTPGAKTSTGSGTGTQTATADVPSGGSACLLVTGGACTSTWERAGIGTYAIDPVTGVITFVPVLGYTGSPVVTYRVTDSFGQTGTATYTATVTAPAAPSPSALTSTGVGTAPQTRTLAIPAGGSVTLLSGGSPVASVVVDGEGRYDLDPATGVVTFTPVLGFTGTPAAVTYRATDAYGQTGEATYTPSVTAPAGPAAATLTSTGVGTAVQTRTVSVTSGGGVTLVGAGGLPSTSVTVTGKGTYAWSAADGELSFTPVLGYAGTAPAATYRVTDAYGQSDEATYTPTVTAPAGPAAATLTSTGIGTAVQTKTVTVPTDGSATLLDGGTPATSKWFPGQGTYVWDAGQGTISFHPMIGFTGTATAVTYRVTDAYGQTETATYAATVTVPAGPTAPPLTSSGIGTAVQTHDVTVPYAGSATLLGAGGLPVTSLTVPGQGTYGWNAGLGRCRTAARICGSPTQVTFTPVRGFAGVATPVTYRVADAYGQTADATYTPTVLAPSGPAAPAVTSTGVGRAPHTRTLDVPADGSVRLLDGGAPVTALTVAGEGAYTLVPATGVVTFAPARGFHGQATTVGYRVRDVYGTPTDGTYRATVTLPDPPAVGPRTSTGVGTAAQSVHVTVPADTELSLTGDRTVDGGTYALDADGATITFTPRRGRIGAAAPITFRVTDEYGQHGEATYTPTVTAPDGPSAPARTSTGVATAAQHAGLPVPDGGSVRLLDADGAPALTVTVDGGTYTLDPATGAVTFAPRAGYTGTPPAVRYLVTDEWGTTATGTYAPAVLPPPGPAAAPQRSTGKPAEPQARVVEVPAGGHVELVDEAGNPVTVLTIPGQGEYRVEPATGVITFVPAPGFTGTPREVRYRVVDAYGQATESSYQPEVESAPARSCRSRRTVEIHWWVPPGVTLKRITVTIAGRRVATLDGRVRRVLADLRGRPKGPVKVAVLGRDARWRAYRTTRTYRLCSPLTAHRPLTTLQLRRAPR